MQPHVLAMLLRTAGLFVAISLAIAPWVIALNVNDPFLNQTWLVLGLGLFGLAGYGIVRLFWQPRRSQFPLLAPGLLSWLAIAAATLHSSYLVSLRTGLVWGSLLLLLFVLRATLRGRDAPTLLALVSVGGLLMAVYALFQSAGHDPLTWPGSPYRVVGTLSNPQYLGAFLLTTLLVTIGLTLDAHLWSPSRRAFFCISALVQTAGMAATDTSSCWAGLAGGVILYATSAWEIRPGRLLRATPLVAGAIATLLFVLVYGSISAGVRSYPWLGLERPPIEHISAVTRLFEWAMGFRLFLHAPLLGIGPGASSYLLSSFRPPFGMAFGLSHFNDDPHAWPVQLLGETGMGGLFAACSLVAALLGVHAWRRHQAAAEETEEKARSAGQRFSLARAALVPALTLLGYGLFNNMLAVPPLVIQGLLLVGLHQALCQRDLRWRKSFSPSGVAYLLLVPAFAAAVWFSQTTHQEVERRLFNGVLLLEAGKPDGAESEFHAALQSNPQSLSALWGLAISQERLGRLPQAMEVLSRLDWLGPNAFAARYQIARIAFERHLLIEAHRMALMHILNNISPIGHELLGRILLAEGRSAEAATAFREGLRFIPSWQTGEVSAAARIRLQLAELETEAGNWGSATALLAALPPDLAGSADVKYLGGLSLYKTGDATGALSLFEQALAADTASNPKFLNAVGFLLGETGGDLERAERLLEEAYALFRAKQPPLLNDI
ncbi:MAG TPA: tetratricopeptide repeat protein, partial [Candidatus Ozemobacteraceae bacterium]|nr:tetratricopeptide repeat protein [Candidatus Ozemobacteraceae bacterium]